MKRALWKCSLMVALIYALVACNSGGVSNSNASTNQPITSNMSLSDFVNQLDYKPLPSSNMVNNFGLSESFASSQYVFLVYVSTTFSSIILNYYSDANCSGDIVFVGSASGNSTFLPGQYGTADKSLYNTCSRFGGGSASDQNCANEESVVRSIQYVFTYTAPTVGRVAACLSNSKNAITGQPGDFYANYMTGTSCTKTGTYCGFSQRYFTPIYARNTIVVESNSFNKVLSPGESFELGVNLNGPAGVNEQYISGVVINNANGFQESTITINPNICVLQNESAPFNSYCGFDVITESDTQSGNYTINLKNQGSIPLSESAIVLTVSDNMK